MGNVQAQRADLSPEIVALLERAAELLNLGAGDCRYEVILSEGRVRYAYLHARHDREQLAERFNRPPAA
jgi:hypothetical protein